MVRCMGPQRDDHSVVGTVAPVPEVVAAVRCLYAARGGMGDWSRCS